MFSIQYETVINQWPELTDRRLIHEIVRRMINALVSDLIESSKNNIKAKHPADINDVRNAGEVLIKLSEQMQEKNLELKRFLRKHLYQHERVQVMTNQAKQTVRMLFEHYMADTGLLPEDIQQNMAGVQQPEERARMVADYIAGMTDRYAIAEFERITQ